MPRFSHTPIVAQEFLRGRVRRGAVPRCFIFHRKGGFILRKILRCDSLDIYLNQPGYMGEGFMIKSDPACIYEPLV